MIHKRSFLIVLTVALFLFACGKPELKTVKQQQVGDYTLTVLSESGSVNIGSSDFFLEFRKTPDNQLTDVGAVEIAPIMEMAGMAPMMASATVMPTDTPGRYHASSTLTMAGLWKFNVKFGSGQSARININAE